MISKMWWFEEFTISNAFHQEEVLSLSLPFLPHPLIHYSHIVRQEVQCKKAWRKIHLPHRESSHQIQFGDPIRVAKEVSPQWGHTKSKDWLPQRPAGQAEAGLPSHILEGSVSSGFRLLMSIPSLESKYTNE